MLADFGISQPSRRLASATTAAFIAIAITGLVNFGGGIWWASELTEQQANTELRIKENQLRILALEAESSRRIAIISEFYQLSNRVERMDDAGQAMSQIMLAVARLEEQVSAIRENQDDLKRQVERVIMDQSPPEQ